MNKVIIYLLLVSLMLIACNDKDIPDVSKVKVDLTTDRFEKDFFAIDTLNVPAALAGLNEKYPGFLAEFNSNILGLRSDSIALREAEYGDAIKSFIRGYRSMYDTTLGVYRNFEDVNAEIKRGLQFVKYYFPQYNVPDRVITFVGPIDAFFQTSFGTQGDIKSGNMLGIGLQLHLGANSSYYNSELGLSLYPDFISRNFDREHIPVNCMKLIVDELYPELPAGKPLLDQMVEKGKRLYLLDKFLPDTDEHIKIGYTKDQMKASHKNEAVVWDFFLDNELLNNAEQNIVKNYIGESPKTQEITNAPGNIGSFTGWQIVKKYMAKFPKTKLEELMQLDARDVYSASKYKPK